MKIKRGLYQTGAPLLLALMLGTAFTACKLGQNSDDQQQGGLPSDPGQAPVNPPTNDIVRYTGMEISDVGQFSIRQAVNARKAADVNSTLVATLRPGTTVNRVARYGNYSLVVWSDLGGTQQGWVDSNVAFTVPVVRVVPDAGVPVFGSIGTQPTTTAVPPPTIPPTTPTVVPPPTTPPTAPTLTPRPTGPTPTPTTPTRPGPTLTPRPKPPPKLGAK
jgi:hypothetical protein